MSIQWKLSNHIFVTYCSVPIIFPLELKMPFNVRFQIFWKLSVFVKLHHQVKEPLQFFILICLINIKFCLLDHIIKVADDVTKDGVSKKNDDDAANSFKAILWIHITKSYCWQWCESKIGQNNSSINTFKCFNIEELNEFVIIPIDFIAIAFILTVITFCISPSEWLKMIVKPVAWVQVAENKP